MVAMNYVAIQAACCTEVDVLAFILMSNHVHFILNGTEEDVRHYINQFKCRYSRYYGRKYGIKEFLRRNKIDLKHVDYRDDSLERSIAYVQMNCVAAKLCLHPSLYKWGSGNCFFSPVRPLGKRLSDYSKRALERLLHSNYVSLPSDWIVCNEGYIYPQSYIDIRTVETAFRTARSMNYYLNSSSKAKKRIEAADDSLPAFSDQTILHVLPELYNKLFHKSSFDSLLEDEQIEMTRQIRFRFSSDTKQIARVCGISYSRAEHLLDSV